MTFRVVQCPLNIDWDKWFLVSWKYAIGAESQYLEQSVFAWSVLSESELPCMYRMYRIAVYWVLLDSRKKFKRNTKGFSSNLLKEGKKQIGQYDLSSEGDFPWFRKYTTSPSLRTREKYWWFRQRFAQRLKMCGIILKVSLSMRKCVLSCHWICWGL